MRNNPSCILHKNHQSIRLRVICYSCNVVEAHDISTKGAKTIFQILYKEYMYAHVYLTFRLMFPIYLNYTFVHLYAYGDMSPIHSCVT